MMSEECSHADYQPDGAAPLSPVPQKAEGDCYLENGTAAKYSEPQALDKAGILKVRPLAFTSV